MEQPTESQTPLAQSPKKKRRRLKVICWLTADVILFTVVFVLLFHTPKGYSPNTQVTDPGDRQHVPRYWSHLSSQIYNGAQTKTPFEITLQEDLFNQAVQEAKWPLRSNDKVALYAPTVGFLSKGVQLRGTAEISGAEMVITVMVTPSLDPNGVANIPIATIHIGAMNITPMAKLMARQAYQKQIAMLGTKPDRIEGKIVASLLNNESFDPVFTVKNLNGRQASVRVESLRLEEKRIIIRLTPILH